MSECKSFAPLVDNKCRVLILDKSLLFSFHQSCQCTYALGRFGTGMAAASAIFRISSLDVLLKASFLCYN